MPAYNEAPSIGAAIDRVNAVLEETAHAFEIVVVSDGSSDDTAAAARTRAAHHVVVIDYPQNRGKGHALLTGSLAARGYWVVWIDADLDLDPSLIPHLVELAETTAADAVIGSKRHPESVVDYPRGRRIGSSGYQALVRILFGLRVRDTQVGLKIFRREVLTTVLPRALVKRYAFDLEVLALARHFGYSRIEEGPIVLAYRFSGSGVNLRAVVQALWDTIAVFYRLRILRSYD